MRNLAKENKFTSKTTLASALVVEETADSTFIDRAPLTEDHFMALPDTLRKTMSLPLVAAPLFIISNPDLVIALCKAGVVGSFPALNARPAAELEKWLQRITRELGVYNEANPRPPLPSTRSSMTPTTACNMTWIYA